MAKRLEEFSFNGPVARYDWANWTDESAWEIRQGSDYEIPTENMRVNLFMKAKQKGLKVRTQIVRDDDGEGLRFQFYGPGDTDGPSTRPPSGPRSAPGASDLAGDDDGIEARWHAEMVGIHEDAKAINYNASRFIQMVNEQGGLVAAKSLIAADQPSDGFTKLWELGRLDISVEARALKPEYRELFSSLELKKCRDRLEAYEWATSPPWEPPSS